MIHAEGTYLLWLDCRKLNMSQEELDRFFVETVKLGLNSGKSFGPGQRLPAHEHRMSAQHGQRGHEPYCNSSKSFIIFQYKERETYEKREW